MSAVNVVKFACDCPGCPATVEAPGDRYSFETGREKMPEGWAIGEGRFSSRRLVVCPEHALILQEAERAMYEWECRETAARNTWMAANPPPRAPSWIDPNRRERKKK